MTSSGGKTLSERIIEYLYKIAPDEANPWDISKHLKANYSSVRKCLSRLLADAESPIEQKHYGFYSHKADVNVVRKIDRKKRIELHGICLQGSVAVMNTGYSIAVAAKKQYRKRGFYKELFEGRLVSITVFESGLVQVWIKTSTNPMNFLEFDRFQGWLKGKLDFVDDTSWVLTQLGLNVDQRELELADVKSVKLTVFRNAWFQVYQKGQDILRWETHLTPRLGLEEAVFILRQLVETKPLGLPENYAPSVVDEKDYSYQ